MTNEKRIASFINSMDTGNGEFLDCLRQRAVSEYVPVIRQETESLLKVLLHMKQPKNILEVGTAVGYSALVMCEHIAEDARITTIEKFEKRVISARANIKEAGKDHIITLLEGDALDVMKGLSGEYDFIFMDAAKGQYIHFLPELMRILDKEGVLVSDNVLQDGEIIESRFMVERRNRTIHARMREYLYKLTHTEGLKTSILPVGDGVAVSIRVKAE